MAAAAVGAALDVPLDEAAAALRTFAPTRMRSHVVVHDGIRMLSDSYNANPVSMRAALETLAELEPGKGGRRIAVLGDMLELGETAVASHDALGRAIVELNIDVVFAYGTHGGEVVRAAVSAGMDAGLAAAFDDKVDLTQAIRELLRPGDVILVKGSRGVALEEVAQDLGFDV